MKKAVILLTCGLLVCNSKALLAEGEGYGANNGGNSGTSVTVSTAADLRNYAGSNSAYNITVSGTIDLGENGSVDVGSNTTIQGANSNATVLGTIVIDGVNNVIIKYLNISANTGGPGANDGVQVRGGSNGVLITKCNIYDCTDGNLDITHGGGSVTVSWCKFYYTRDNGHNFSNLIGASDDDFGTYTTTWHHNWWAEGCQQRMTATRFGPCHMYNNYWSSSGNDYCTTSRNVCEMLSENNYYDGVEDPLAKEQNGTLRTSGNIFNNCTGSQTVSNDNVFSPPYSYSLDAASSVRDIVRNNAGNTGNNGNNGGNGSFNGTYSIIAAHSGKAVDTYNFGTGDGTNIVQWDYWGGDAQRFNLTPVDGEWHRITPVISSGQGLDVDGISTARGANIHTWTYWGGDNQQFRFQDAGNGYYNIIARHSGKCLDVENASTADGANIQQWSCSGAEQQRFQVVVNTGVRLKPGETESVAGFALYPNPATNRLHIDFRGKPDGNQAVTIYNIAGKQIYSSEITGNGLAVDISGFTSGIYVVKLRNQQEIVTQKFTKK